METPDLDSRGLTINKESNSTEKFEISTMLKCKTGKFLKGLVQLHMGGYAGNLVCYPQNYGGYYNWNIEHDFSFVHVEVADQERGLEDETGNGSQHLDLQAGTIFLISHTKTHLERSTVFKRFDL